MPTAEEILKEKGHEMLSVSPQATIYEALTLMNERKVGSIVVKDGEGIVGIWTERDLLADVLDKGFELKTSKISDYMSKSLKYSEHNESVYQLQDKFLGMRLRHLLIRKEGKVIGLLSSGDVMKAVLNTKERELKELNAMIGWEYYENWRWSNKS